MVRDTQEKIKRARNDLFDEDPDDDDDGLDAGTWKVIQIVLSIGFLLGVIALVLFLYGDSIMGLITQLQEMMETFQNPTGFQ